MAAVKVTGLTSNIGEQQLKEFFSYSGEVSSVEIFEEMGGRSAIVRFTDASALETALLLTGATIVSGDPPVTVVAHEGGAPVYATGAGVPEGGLVTGFGDASGSTIIASEPLPPTTKAQMMVGMLIEKGYVLGESVIERAKALDEKHQIAATVKGKAGELNDKLQIKEKAAAAAAAVGATARDLNEQYRIVDRTKEAAAAAVTKAKDLNEQYQIVDRTKGAAAAAVAKAKELNEQHQIVNKASAAGSAAYSAAAGLATKVAESDAAANAVTSLKQGLNFLSSKAETLLAKTTQPQTQ